MSSAVLISKSGNINTINNLNINDLNSHLINKRTDKIKLLHNWSLPNDEKIKLFGFTNGRERLINKHELVPPIDNELYYGDLILYKIKSNKIVDFTAFNYHQWYQSIYQIEDLDDNIIEDELFEDEEEDEYEYGDFVVKD